MTFVYMVLLVSKIMGSSLSQPHEQQLIKN